MALLTYFKAFDIDIQRAIDPGVAVGVECPDLGGAVVAAAAAVGGAFEADFFEDVAEAEESGGDGEEWAVGVGDVGGGHDSGAIGDVHGGGETFARGALRGFGNWNLDPWMGCVAHCGSPIGELRRRMVPTLAVPVKLAVTRARLRRNFRMASMCSISGSDRFRLRVFRRGRSGEAGGVSWRWPSRLIVAAGVTEGEAHAVVRRAHALVGAGLEDDVFQSAVSRGSSSNIKSWRT